MTTEEIKEIQNSPIEYTREVLVNIGVELGLIAIGVLVILTRRQLSQLKEFIFDHIKKPKFSLDPTTQWKQKVYYYLNSIVINEIADWGGICIFSNGEVSEFGYHFTKLRLEFKVETPYNDLPIAFVDTLNATQLSISLYGHLCSSDSPGVTYRYNGYCIHIFPVYLKNIMVACLLLGYDQPRDAHSCPNQLQDIAKLFEDQVTVFK